jgi:1,4-alpha-glucan branching enzyme
MIKKVKNEVTFQYDETSKVAVYLAGDFNNWSETKTPLVGKAGKWSVKLTLPKGEYQFKYLVNGKWENDKHADKYVKNAMGSENSVVVVK